MSLRPSSGTHWGILVVDDDLATLRPVLELLRQTGYSAAGALHLETASSMVRALPFDLLIAGVRPGADSTLDLLRLARRQQPGMAVIAITATADDTVEQECSRLGASYLLKPVNLPSLLELVAEKVSDLSRRRRWARKHILGGFAASIGGQKAKVVDMSYGGFRVEMPEPPRTELPAPVEVTLLSFGLSVNATLVWTRSPDSPGPSTSLGTGPSTSLGTGPSTSLGTGPWLSGGALRETDESTTRAWRVVVDALPDWIRPGQQNAPM